MVEIPHVLYIQNVEHLHLLAVAAAYANMQNDSSKKRNRDAVATDDAAAATSAVLPMQTK